MEDYHIETILGEQTNSKEYLILNAAIQSFAEKGFHNTKTKDIAMRAGVAEGTIFRYFKTKDDIIQKMFPLALKLFIPKFTHHFSQNIGKHGKMNLKEAVTFIVKDRFKLINTNKKILLAIIPEMMYREELRKSIIEVASKEIFATLDHLYDDLIINKDGLNKDQFKEVTVSTVIYFSLSRGLFTTNVDEDKVNKEIESYINGISQDWSGRNE